MTSNQRRAIEIAQGVLSGGSNGSLLTDGEWHLLLLGAGLNCHHAPLLNVAGRVLENANRHAGYFAPAGSDTGAAQLRQHAAAVATAVAAAVAAAELHCFDEAHDASTATALPPTAVPPLPLGAVQAHRGHFHARL